MIYTVTFNPAIDYVMHTSEVNVGMVNRSSCEEIYFGGKGVNVSVVLGELGLESIALGFVGGFTGDAIEKGIREKGVKTDFVHLKNGYSRINVKIKSTSETELNGQGPEIPEEALSEFFGKLGKLKDGDIIILAGSIPNTLPTDIYERIMKKLSDRKIKTVVDATGDLLKKILKYKPFLIKPNNHELGEIFGTALNTVEQVTEHAKKLKELGAVNVLVSMAEKGAVLLDEYGNIHISEACKGTVKNSVGAGDSMVAGFVAGSLAVDYEYALQLGTATGGATAFSDGLAVKDDIYTLMKQIERKC